MQFRYARPFSFQIGSRPESKASRPELKVTGVRHGVTEITLDDGRQVRATLHIKSVKTDPTKPGSLDIACNVVAEIMTAPDTIISPVHETLQ